MKYLRSSPNALVVDDSNQSGQSLHRLMVWLVHIWLAT